MAIGSSRQIKIGAILSYVHIIVGAIITLAYTPFMIRILGKSEYGLYNTVSSVISSLALLSLGFGSSYVKFFTQYRARDDEQGEAKLNGMFMTIFVVIGIIALVCGVFISNNLKFVFKNGLTTREMKTARKLMLLLTFNLSLSFPASVFTSIITANERFIFQKIIVLIRQVISPIVCIPILLKGYASVGMVIGTVIVHLICDLTNAVFVIKKLHVKFVFRGFDIFVFRSIARYSGFIAINMVVDQINLSIDKILLGRFCGTVSVAVYSAGFTLYSYYQTFSIAISNVFTPRIHNVWSDTRLKEQRKEEILSEMFSKIGRIQFIILLLVSSGLVFFGKPFIAIWAGDGYENAYYVVLLLSISAIVPLSQNIGVEIQRAKNKHQFRSILYGIMAIINLVLSIYLCQLYGEIGSALGTAISFIVANTVLMNWYYYHILHIDISLYWKQVLHIIIAFVPVMILGNILGRVVDLSSKYYLLFSIMLYTIIFIIVMLALECTSEERKKLKNVLCKKKEGYK